jgi:hypothetical protein
LALIVLVGGSAAAQGPLRSRPAPLRPPSFGTESKGAEAPPPVLSRDELLRRFDLNFDGKIDEAEGEIGRAKLRREREEEERQRQEREEINPLTGRPRSEGGLEKEAEPRKRRIISIDDVDMRDAAIERVQDAVKGPPGSAVKLLVARAGAFYARGTG